MKPTIKAKSSGSDAGLKAALAQIKKSQVLVGIPEDKAARKEGQIGNAALLFIHTNGSPLQHIPARPVIEPAIEAHKPEITQELKEAAAGYLDHNSQAAMRHLRRAGMLGRNAAISWFTDPRNAWAANSPLTVARKGSDRPLLDTGQLRRSLTYIVETK